MTSLRSNNKSARIHSSGARFFLVRLFVVGLFLLLATRLIYVQAILRGDLQERASRQFAAKDRIQASRHRILDRNLSTLAETVPVYSCFIDPSLIKNKSAVAQQVAAILGMDPNGLLHRLKNTPGSFLWLKRNVPPPLMNALKKKNITGIGFRREMRRNYPSGQLAAQILGLVGVEGRGLTGMEREFEESLNPPPQTEEQGVPAKIPGGHLKLTIDARIQQIAERELEWGAKKINAKKGMVVIQEPSSGNILAMASWPPVYLNADNPPDIDKLNISPVVDVFEPGSTFKIVAAAAAIQEKAVSFKEVFDGENGAWKVSGITIHDHEPLKRMTFEDILVYSSNVGTAKIAERIGSEKLYQYARLFGFGVFPGSMIPGEAKGVLRTPDRWSGVSKYTVSFGQEVGVTGLQLIGAYSAIANGGVLMEPRIVDSVLSEKSEVLWNYPTAQIRRVISEEAAEKLKDMLVKVVEKGTGQSAAILWNKDIKVAGKTGTAQKYDSERRRYHEHLTLISFCGFFPADSPKFTVLVILDEPEGRRWGGLDAAPVFRRIAEQINSFSGV